MISVQLYPCDSKPCVNGGTCSNDDKDFSLYHCHCIDDYSGKNCQGTRFLRLSTTNHRDIKETATATVTPGKRLNEENNGCARAL